MTLIVLVASFPLFSFPPPRRERCLEPRASAPAAVDVSSVVGSFSFLSSVGRSPRATIIASSCVNPLSNLSFFRIRWTTFWRTTSPPPHVHLSRCFFCCLGHTSFFERTRTRHEGRTPSTFIVPRKVFFLPSSWFHNPPCRGGPELFSVLISHVPLNFARLSFSPPKNVSHYGRTFPFFPHLELLIFICTNKCDSAQHPPWDHQTLSSRSTESETR